MTPALTRRRRGTGRHGAGFDGDVDADRLDERLTHDLHVLPATHRAGEALARRAQDQPAPVELGHLSVLTEQRPRDALDAEDAVEHIGPRPTDVVCAHASARRLTALALAGTLLRRRRAAGLLRRIEITLRALSLGLAHASRDALRLLDPRVVARGRSGPLTLLGCGLAVTCRARGTRLTRATIPALNAGGVSTTTPRPGARRARQIVTC